MDSRRWRGGCASSDGVRQKVIMLNQSLGENYSVGSQGSDVMKIQQALQLAGFSTGPIDGKFGPKTKTAVQSFQSAQGIGIDGIVGPVTWQRLLAGTPPPGKEAPVIVLPAPVAIAKQSVFGNLFSGLGNMASILGLGLGLVVFLGMKKKRRGRR